jgi:hypothetical protein
MNPPPTLELYLEGAELRFRLRGQSPGAELLDFLRTNKQTLTRLLLLPPPPPRVLPGPSVNGDGQHPPAQSVGIPATVTISGQVFPVRRWDGTPLPGRWLAFDTETDAAKDIGTQIQDLVLATASSGPQHSVIIHPDDVGRFILAHRERHLVAHHSAFDFWVVQQHLHHRGEHEALTAWWDVIENNRLHDTMLLDMLVRLARDDTFPDRRPLDVVARQYASLAISKDDPYRLRYGEISNQGWDTVPAGFFEYAVKDSIVTLPAYREIRRQALALVRAFGRSEIRRGARREFGLLTEGVQVKKAVALAQIQRHGMAVNLDLAGRAKAGLRQRLEEAVAAVRGVAPELYKTDKNGDLVRGGDYATPSKNKAALIARLEEVAEQIKEETGTYLAIPRTPKKRELSTSTKFWAEYREHHPFLEHWVAAEELAKLVPFVAGLGQDRVHPRYEVMMRSGRTSASAPNIQQVPRESTFRNVFVPAPGYLLLTSDYSAIELCTLAATTLHRFGHSDMAEVLARGVDPHAYTASLMLGISLEEFLSWKADPQRRGEYDKARQAAKAVNFGIPGGLGVRSLVSYAKRTYGVELTVEEAKGRRELLTKQIYTELDLYLFEDGAAILARNLCVPLEQLRKTRLGDTHLSCVRKILTGDPKKNDGTDYDANFVKRVRHDLDAVNRRPELKEPLALRQTGKELANRVCMAGVATLTGRIRGRVGYSQARNTPFQGLAADGAGLALFALVREGFRVVAFIHDEVLVELPDLGGYVNEGQVRRVEEILRTEMARVLPPKIPVKVESALATRWDKKARLVVRDRKVFPGS